MGLYQVLGVARSDGCNNDVKLAGCWSHSRRKFYELHVAESSKIATEMVASAELFALAVTATIIAPLLPRLSYRRAGLLALILTLLARAASIAAGGWTTLLVLRGLAGVGEGVFYAISLSIVASHCSNPEKVFGYFQLVWAIGSVLLFSVGGEVTAAFAHYGIFALLAAITLVLAPLLFLVPNIRAAKDNEAAIATADAELIALIEDIQDELPCYGYRRVTHELHRRGHLVNHKRVARAMRANGLRIKPRKRYVRTTDSNHGSPVYPNLYRNLIPSRPDMVWVADFTYIRITAGFCYLAVILDACSRKVVGYALSKRIDTPLALAALRSALENRTPPPGCIHHTDRGCQYASETYRRALMKPGYAAP